MKHKKSYLIISIIFVSLFMMLIDGVLQPPYAIKSQIKLLLFFFIPFFYLSKNKEELPYFKQLFKFKKQAFKQSLWLVILIYLTIIIAYFILKNFIDFNVIIASLSQSANVSAKNFIYVAIYISTINSLLEEIFYRGYAFLFLKRHTSRSFAYICSSLLFAIYHLGMSGNWFSPILLGLSLTGLAIGGCLFNYLNEKTNTIYPSWMVHMAANLAINTIGLVMFGII